MPPSTRERLEQLAADDHIGMSEIVRRLIDRAWRDREARVAGQGGGRGEQGARTE